MSVSRVWLDSQPGILATSSLTCRPDYKNGLIKAIYAKYALSRQRAGPKPNRNSEINLNTT